MSVTLLTGRTQTRSNLDEVSAANWTNAELNILLNQRYHRVITAIMTVYEDYYITTDLFNTTANKQEHTSADGIATNIFKIRRVELNYNPADANSAPTRCLPITEIDAVRRDLGYQNTNAGLKAFANASYYTFGFGSNFTIGFLPIPDKTATGAGKIWYVATQADLASDSDTFNIPYPERYWQIITDGATGDALRFGQQDTTEADRYDKKFGQALLLMQEELEDKIAEEGKTILDVSGENMDFGGF